MRTMPMVLASSVDVASTARAQRMHRRISTEATGRWLLSMLKRYPGEEEEDDDDAEEMPESEDDDLEAIISVGKEDVKTLREGMVPIYICVYIFILRGWRQYEERPLLYVGRIALIRAIVDD